MSLVGVLTPPLAPPPPSPGNFRPRHSFLSVRVSVRVLGRQAGEAARTVGTHSPRLPSALSPASPVAPPCTLCHCASVTAPQDGDKGPDWPPTWALVWASPAPEFWSALLGWKDASLHPPTSGPPCHRV